MSKKHKDFIIDFETLSDKPNALLIDCSIVVFDPDPKNLETFDQLITQGIRIKFDMRSQKGIRHTNDRTIQWWKDMPSDARKNLMPSPDDVTIEVGTKMIVDFLEENGIKLWDSQGWCRGMSFDFPIFTNMFQQTFKTDYTQDVEPIKFWNQRDIRTAIEAYTMVRGMTVTPIRKGVLDGFVAHDSIHDCAKDIIMLKTAQRYILGIEEIPTEEDTDPVSLPKKRK